MTGEVVIGATNVTGSAGVPKPPAGTRQPLRPNRQDVTEQKEEPCTKERQTVLSVAPGTPAGRTPNATDEDGRKPAGKVACAERCDLHFGGSKGQDG